ncbi:MAG TPA: phage tail tape measure protein, partial [Aliarcobacter sp.]|nr:phage tail tape measure protein [Aliarcobacter sp.]
IGLTRNIKLMDKSFALGKGLESYRQKFKDSFFDKLALGASVVAPLKIAIDFESAMADVKKVVNFDTPQQFKEMEEDILKLGRTLPMAHEGITKLVAAGGQAGFAREDLIAFATDAGKMATAFDELSADDAGEMMAKWRTGFKMSQDEVRTLADQINYLSNETATSTTSLASVLTSVGSLGEVAGLSASSILALGTTMTSVGVGQDVAATGIKNFMLSLVAGEQATAKQQDAYKKLGLDSMQVAKGMQKDSEGTVLKVLEGVSKLNKVDQASTLQALFGKESLAAIAPLLTNLDDLKKNLNTVGDATKYAGAVQKEYEARSATTANNMLLLGNTISEISIRFGSLLLPAINSVLQPMKYIGGLVSSFVETFPTFSKVVGIAVVGAIGLSIGLSALGFMGSFALTGLLSLGRGLLVLNSLFLANPIGLAIAGIALAVGLIYVYWEPIKGFFAGLWDGIVSIFNNAISFIKTYLGWTPLGMILNNWGFITNFFSELWGGVVTIFSTTWENIKSSFNGVIDFIKQPFEEFFNWIGSKFEWVNGAIGSTLGFFKDVGNGIGDGLKSASNFFKIDKGEDKSTLNSLDGKSNSAGLNYSPLPTDKNDIVGNGGVKQTNNIQVTVNNPESTVDVTKGIQDAMASKKSNNYLNDQEF